MAKRARCPRWLAYVCFAVGASLQLPRHMPQPQDATPWDLTAFSSSDLPSLRSPVSSSVSERGYGFGVGIGLLSLRNGQLDCFHLNAPSSVLLFLLALPNKSFKCYFWFALYICRTFKIGRYYFLSVIQQISWNGSERATDPCTYSRFLLNGKGGKQKGYYTALLANENATISHFNPSSEFLENAVSKMVV